MQATDAAEKGISHPLLPSHLLSSRQFKTETSSSAACTRSHRVPAEDQPRQ